MKTHLNISIDVELARALDVWAVEQKLSRSGAVEQLVRSILAKDDIPGFDDPPKRVVTYDDGRKR